MYKTLFLPLIFTCLAFVTTAQAQHLGANFNENMGQPLDYVDHMKKNNIYYVRAFAPFNRNFFTTDSNGHITGVNRSVMRNYAPGQRFLRVKSESGGAIRLVLSLKVIWREMGGVPTLGTPHAETVFSGYKYFLEQGYGDEIDILVMGNEPYHSVLNPDNEKYRLLMREFANRLANWKQQNGWNFDVYAGSLNQTSRDRSHTITPKLINLAQNNPNIDGIDIHSHAYSVPEMVNDFKRVREEFGFTKKIISTEFSIVHTYTEHMGDRIGTWGANNGFDPNLKMYQWLNQLSVLAADGNPLPGNKIEQFFESRQWHPDNWYAAYYDAAQRYNVHAIIGRMYTETRPRSYTADTNLWDIGSVFSGALAGTKANGDIGPNPVLYPEWKKISDALYCNCPIYIIKHKVSGKVLGANGDNLTVKGGNTNNASVRWRRVNAGGGNYYLVNVAAQRKLHNNIFQKGDKMNLGIITRAVDNYKWKIIDAGGNFKRLVHQGSDRFVHLGDNGALNTLKLGPTTWTGNRTQWQLIQVN